MKTKFFTILLLSLSFTLSYAQQGPKASELHAANATSSIKNVEWSFNTFIVESDLKVERYAKNSFSPKVGALKEMFIAGAVSQDEMGSGDASSLMSIKNPLIYNSILGIERHYKKLKRKKTICEQDVEDFEYILQVGVCSLTSPDSDDFSVALKNLRGDVEAQIALFKSVKLVDPYM